MRRLTNLGSLLTKEFVDQNQQRGYLYERCSTVQQITMTSKERVTVNIDQTEYLELQELARAHNVSMAWLGRQAITRLLEQYKQREFQLPLNLNQQTGT